MDGFTELGLLIFLVGVLAGALLAWCPRIVLLRALRRIRQIEDFLTSDRNKKASRARWDAKPEDDPLVRQLTTAKENPKGFDNDFFEG